MTNPNYPLLVAIDFRSIFPTMDPIILQSIFFLVPQEK